MYFTFSTNDFEWDNLLDEKRKYNFFYLINNTHIFYNNTLTTIITITNRDSLKMQFFSKWTIFEVGCWLKCVRELYELKWSAIASNCWLYSPLLRLSRKKWLFRVIKMISLLNSKLLYLVQTVESRHSSDRKVSS